MGEAFKVGDTVQLRSGGPKMTVTNIGDRYGTLTVWCAWFDNVKKLEETFPVESLRAIS
jgi:uncharacterized protein YodC (DUF2158 family)